MSGATSINPLIMSKIQELCERAKRENIVDDERINKICSDDRIVSLIEELLEHEIRLSYATTVKEPDKDFKLRLIKLIEQKFPFEGGGNA